MKTHLHKVVGVSSLVNLYLAPKDYVRLDSRFSFGNLRIKITLVKNRIITPVIHISTPLGVPVKYSVKKESTKDNIEIPTCGKSSIINFMRRGWFSYMICILLSLGYLVGFVTLLDITNVNRIILEPIIASVIVIMVNSNRL